MYDFEPNVRTLAAGFRHCLVLAWASLNSANDVHVAVVLLFIASVPSLSRGRRRSTCF